MRMMKWLLVLTIAVPGGCDKAGSGSGAEGKKSSPKASSAQWKRDVTMDCPAYSRGSKTTVVASAKGVTVTVTHPEKTTVAEIRKRAHYVAGATQFAKDPESALNFGGATGDRAKNCPVILKGTRITAHEIPGGARLEVEAKDTQAIATLQALSRRKLTTLQAVQEAFK